MKSGRFHTSCCRPKKYQILYNLSIRLFFSDSSKVYSVLAPLKCENSIRTILIFSTVDGSIGEFSVIAPIADAIVGDVHNVPENIPVAKKQTKKEQKEGKYHLLDLCKNNCRQQCQLHFAREFRQRILDYFYLTSFGESRIFFDSHYLHYINHITPQEIKRRKL